MSDLQKQYFILQKPDGDEYPFLKPNANTGVLKYRSEPPSPGQVLTFTNGWRKENLEEGIKEIIGDTLFNTSDVLVRDNIHALLKAKKLEDIHFYPAIYIDDKDNWHEDYWYMTVLKKIDCWCREQSDYNADKPIAGDLYHIRKIVLDEAVLLSIPLEERLVFKLDKSLRGYVLIHESVKDIFVSDACHVVPVSDLVV